MLKNSQHHYFRRQNPKAVQYMDTMRILFVSKESVEVTDL